MANPILLSVNYGTNAPATAAQTDGALYFDTVGKYVHVKLPSTALYKINAGLADDATSAIASLTSDTTSVGALTSKNYAGSNATNVIVPGVGLYAESSTADTTAAKVATITAGVMPMTAAKEPLLGTLVAVKFTAASNSSGVAPTTLEIEYNGTKSTAKNIRNSYSQVALAKNILVSNRVVIFYYDGTNWVSLNDVNVNTNTTYSLISEAEATTGPTATARLINGLQLSKAVQTRLEAGSNGQLVVKGTAPSGTTLEDKTITVYTHPTHTAKSSNLYKITVDSLGHVSAATAITSTDIANYGFKLWADIQTTGVKNPAALSFVTDGSGDHDTAGSYDGSTGKKISYNSVGAAPASNIQLSAIDWTSGGANFKLPSTIMPKEALLDLKVDSTNDNPNGIVRNDVQVGDLIQTNTNKKLWYVSAVAADGKITATEITVGSGIASSVANSLYIRVNASSPLVSFSGADAGYLYLQSSIISTNSASATTQVASASGKNEAFINYMFNADSSATAPTASVTSSIKLMGAGGLTVTTSEANVISITHPSTLKTAQNNIGSEGGTITVNSGKLSFIVPRLSVNTTGHVTAIAGSTIQIAVEQGLTSGDLVAKIGGLSLYSGVTWGTF